MLPSSQGQLRHVAVAAEKKRWEFVNLVEQGLIRHREERMHGGVAMLKSDGECAWVVEDPGGPWAGGGVGV